MTTLNLTKSEMESKANFYMNEISYLLPSIDTEKAQGREFVGKLSNLVENMELSNVRQSLIDACMDCLTLGLKKFA